MKKIFTGMTILILLTCTQTLLAQDTNTLTKKDAVFFINKVLENFRNKDKYYANSAMSGDGFDYYAQGYFIDREIHSDSTLLTLNRCNLIITDYVTLVKPIIVDKKTEIVKLIYVGELNLSSAKLNLEKYGKFLGLADNSNSKGIHLTLNFIMHHLKNNTTTTYGATKLDDPTHLTGDFSNLYLNGLFNTESTTYIENGYNDRLIKAFNFLIESCSGGEIKTKQVDTGNKF